MIYEDKELKVFTSEGEEETTEETPTEPVNQDEEGESSEETPDKTTEETPAE